MWDYPCYTVEVVFLLDRRTSGWDVMADNKKMSVAEILAAARQADGGGAADEKPAAAAASAETTSNETSSNETSSNEAAAAETVQAEPTAPAEKPKPAKSASGGRPAE